MTDNENVQHLCNTRLTLRASLFLLLGHFNPVTLYSSSTDTSRNVKSLGNNASDDVNVSVKDPIYTSTLPPRSPDICLKFDTTSLGGMFLNTRNTNDSLKHMLEVYELAIWQCILSTTESVYPEVRWERTCLLMGSTKDEIHFTLRAPMQTRTAAFRNVTCIIYGHAFFLFKLVTMDIDNCTFSCFIEHTAIQIDGSEKVTPMASFSVKVFVQDMFDQDLGFSFERWGCARYFQFIKIVSSVGAVLAVSIYLVWYKIYLTRSKVKESNKMSNPPTPVVPTEV
ncbi:hypothetical protein Bpfe_016180 [Biomphalaria pfeifferi]|uniref:Uncharacterized protein n=1 Tax=Biomphalaria pfeifferi TaxID=112525 RepID=A0AAD8BHP8_BIOPF|nr:hypothetical protein Bpfe_016180 [Biomphalaria pfeifferi]